jgi:uncharacterized sporulation protein YeaH/YhbH (DUF444 family)
MDRLSSLNQPENYPFHNEGGSLADITFTPSYLTLTGFGIDIQPDRARYRDIARGKIREDLGKYMSQDEIIAQKGNDIIKIPLPRIDNPHFQTQSANGEGVGQGDGEPGESISRGKGKKGSGSKPGQGKGKGEGEGEGQEAGEGEGNHIYEEVTIEQFADMIGEKLQLPRIEPKGDQKISSDKGRYTTISRHGPQALRHTRRTFKEALKRSLSSGEYDPDNPVIIPEREDFRYKAFKPEPRPEFNACIIYVMDVSYSMNSGQKEIARKVAFWIDLWLQRQYQGVERVFIIHDEKAKEVTEEEFFSINANGGTKISSAYKEVLKVAERFPASQWNRYLFQFSDGDNYDEKDDSVCTDLLKEQILPFFNQVAYGQIPFQSSRTPPSAETQGFYKTLQNSFNSAENFVQTPIADDTKILDAIKKFFSGGR